MQGDHPLNSSKLLLKISNIQNKVAEILDREIILFTESLSDDISEIITYLFRQGGKRLRPAFFVYIASQINKDVNIAPYALSIELIHNMSLYHDDVIDKAVERRGAPTVHEHYDIATAIVGGDILHSQIHRHLLQSVENEHIGLESTIKFLHELLTVEVQIGGSVLKEMKLSSSPDIPSFEESLHVTTNKTAPLFGFSAKAAAIVCNRFDMADLLYEFGYEYGTAFQLLDDLLDYFKSDKDLGGDLRESKKTPLISLINNNNSGIVNKYLGKQHISEEEINLFIRQCKDEFLQIIKYIEEHLYNAYNLIDTIEINNQLTLLFNIVEIKITEIKSKLRSI